MAKIIIRNVGPIKEAEFDLNKVNVFMGPQSSGKSTIAKIISYCTWVEKDVATSQSLEDYQDNQNYFRERLEFFHKIKGYFKPNSFIEYKSDIITLKYDSGKFEIAWVDRYAYKRSKISYIPSERNFVILSEMEKVELPKNNIRNFLFDWFTAKKIYSQDKKLSILNLGVDYYYDEDKAKDDHIHGKDSNGDYDILLSNASSGLQSLVPLLAMTEFITDWIYNTEEEISFEQNEKRAKVIQYLIKEILLKPYFKQSSVDNNEIKEKIEQVIQKIKTADIEAIDLANKYNVVNTNLFTTNNSQLIIEEPEQNLFPETQKDLIYHLLEKCINNERNHRLTITTHSPYILYALNNCMMGGLVYNKMSEQDKKRIKCNMSLITPDKVSIYEIKNGFLKSIQEEDGLIGNNYFDKKMKDIMDDFYTMLNYYE